MANGMQNGAEAAKGFDLELSNLTQGVEKVIPPGSSMMVNGQSYTQPQLVALLKGALALYEDVRLAKAALIGAIQKRRQKDAATHELYQQLKAALIANFGRSNPQLGRFGLKPRSPRALTGPEKQLRAAKAKITRRKRNTMGSRQKAGVKSIATPVVTLGPTGVTVTPAAADLGAAEGVGSGTATSGATPASEGNTGASSGTGGSSSGK
jgi:hypothetical protein